MNKKENRLLSWLLTLIMVVSMVPVNVTAEEAYAEAGLIEEETVLYGQNETDETVGQDDNVILQEENAVPVQGQMAEGNQTAEEGQLAEEEKTAEAEPENLPDLVDEDMIALDEEGILWEDAPKLEDKAIDDTQVMEIPGFTYINPLYRDIISEEDLVHGYWPERLLGSETGNIEYLEVDQAVEEVRKNLLRREQNFTIYVKTKDPDIGKVITEIPARAMEHTTKNPTWGDYISFQYAGWKTDKFEYMESEGEYRIPIPYTFTFYTTLEQETELDNKIETIKTELELTGKTDYQKIKAIYDYLCEKVTYDYKNLEIDDYKLKYTAYAALMNNTAVCQGYAVAFYRLALESGVDARIISGDGVNSEGKNGAHAWNIVRLGDKYYNLDATWDAPRRQIEMKYDYFLKSANSFVGDHIRKKEFTTEPFATAYPMAASDFNENSVGCEVKGHTFSEWKVDKKATCAETGVESRTCTVCQKNETKEIPATGHTVVKDAAVAATCTEAGKTEGSHCSVCNTVIVAQKEVSATGHTYGDWKVKKVATCTEEGTETRNCSKCDNTEERTIPKKEHTLVPMEGKAATCTETGLTEGSHCSVCGTVIKAQEIIPVKDHSYGDWAVEKEATCTEAGKEIRSCTVCDHEETRAIPATGHTVVTDAAVAATCTEAGKTAGSHCSVCHKVITPQEIIPAKGHTEVIDEEKAATCTEDGKTQGSHCSVCGTVLTPQENIQATGHTYGEWTVEKDSTCTEEGTETRTCSKCHNTEKRAIPQKEHTLEAIKGKAATCTEIGLTEGSYCSVCKAVIKAQKEIPAKGHNYEVWTVTKEATCTEAGEETSICTVCGHEETRAISAKGHTYGDWEVEKGATCTEEGMETRICSKCNNTEERTIPKKEHTLVPMEGKAATCTESGLTEGSHCSVCGKVLKEQEVLPAKGHTYGDWTIEKAATCTESGIEIRTCTVCGNKETRAIPATGHTFSAWNTISEATVFAAETQSRSCSVCGTSEVRTAGSPLNRTISVTASSLKMKKGQKTTAFKVTFAQGDSVESWTSSDAKLVAVNGKPNGTCTIAAKNVTGKKPVTLTVTLKSGLSKKIKITVQKGKVTATSVKLETKKITLKKGKTFKLKPIVSPITNQDKVTYQSKNKKIASVSKNGVVKGVKKGKTTIIVKAGKKSVTCTVTVK